MIHKLSAGLTEGNFIQHQSISSLKKFLYILENKKFHNILSNPSHPLNLPRLYDAYFSKVSNERILSKGILKGFVNAVILYIVLKNYKQNEKVVNDAHRFVGEASDRLDFPNFLFGLETNEMTLMLCLVKAREKNKQLLNRKNVIYTSDPPLLPLMKDFDLFMILELCRSNLSADYAAQVANDLLLPDSLEIGEVILKEFAEKYPNDPFSGRIRRAFREKEIRSKLGLIADIWNQANNLLAFSPQFPNARP